MGCRRNVADDAPWHSVENNASRATWSYEEKVARIRSNGNSFVRSSQGRDAWARVLASAVGVAALLSLQSGTHFLAHDVWRLDCGIKLSKRPWPERPAHVVRRERTLLPAGIVSVVVDAFVQPVPHKELFDLGSRPRRFAEKGQA